MSVCLSLSFFFIDINSMPHYTAILHALHNFSCSFTITFTFNNNKTIVDIHYNVDNNILTPSLVINKVRSTHMGRSYTEKQEPYKV